MGVRVSDDDLTCAGDLGALLDAAVDAVLAGGRQITGVDLPSSLTFVFRTAGRDAARRVERADAIELVAATRARVDVSIAGICEGHTVIELFETPMMAMRHRFKVGGVTLGRSRFRVDGTVDWNAPITRAELEANGLAAVNACNT